MCFHCQIVVKCWNLFRSHFLVLVNLVGIEKYGLVLRDVISLRDGLSLVVTEGIARVMTRVLILVLLLIIFPWVSWWPFLFWTEMSQIKELRLRHLFNFILFIVITCINIKHVIIGWVIWPPIITLFWMDCGSNCIRQRLVHFLMLLLYIWLLSCFDTMIFVILIRIKSNLSVFFHLHVLRDIRSRLVGYFNFLEFVFLLGVCIFFKSLAKAQNIFMRGLM